jgi:hypothetical protein
MWPQKDPLLMEQKIKEYRTSTQGAQLPLQPLPCPRYQKNEKLDQVLLSPQFLRLQDLVRGTFFGASELALGELTLL